MKYIVYITINLCNGKFYIGVHRTNPETFDGYIGCLIYRLSQANKNYALHKAVRKYGYKNFKRTTIAIFPDTDEGRRQAFLLEAILVNETLLKSKNVYNTSVGGRANLNEDLTKRVYLFDLSGNFIRSFISAREAALYMAPLNQDVVRKAIKNNCLGATSSSYGYYWSYKKEFGYKNDCVKEVALYTLSGKFIRTFKSIAEAERELSLNTISQAIRKNYSSGGYLWRYYEGDNSDIPTLINIKTKVTNLPIIMIKDGIETKYDSVKQCVEKNPDLKTSQINRVLNKVIKSHKGYNFVYQDGDIV